MKALVLSHSQGASIRKKKSGEKAQRRRKREAGRLKPRGGRISIAMASGGRRPKFSRRKTSGLSGPIIHPGFHQTTRAAAKPSVTATAERRQRHGDGERWAEPPAGGVHRPPREAIDHRDNEKRGHGRG
jgi:hypothetical protein